MKVVTPAIELSSFSCPHCGALAYQSWARLLYRPIPKGEYPFVGWTNPRLQSYISGTPTDPAQTQRLMLYANELSLGRISIDTKSLESQGRFIENLHTSQCYSCDEITVWRNNEIIFPETIMVAPANSDMPEEIKQDFNEARSIFNSSPRASAALLRLCVQKLCKHLGEPGKDINTDIASLVRKGLHPKVQKSLDAVRVIGNDAVHPGVMDLNDNRELASSLFLLVNVIVDEMITRLSHIDGAYDAIPQSKKDAIEKRDQPKS